MKVLYVSETVFLNEMNNVYAVFIFKDKSLSTFFYVYKGIQYTLFIKVGYLIFTQVENCMFLSLILIAVSTVLLLIC